MVNWSLQPEEVEVVEEVVTEPVATDETTETDEAPAQEDLVLSRIAALEEANKRADALGTDLRRSVGRVQSILDRMETATGKTKAELESALDERFNELSGLLEDVSTNIDDAILPDSVKDKVRTARAQAANRSAAVNIDKLVEEKIAAMIKPQTPVNDGVTPEMRLFERLMETQIKSAGLDPDGGDFDWQYVKLLLENGRRGDAEKYFADIIETNTSGAKLQAKKEAVSESPTGSGTAANKQWHEKLGDKNVSLEDKINLLRSQGALR